jgi:glycosyltransferase involved in cell wall biosynthesis
VVAGVSESVCRDVESSLGLPFGQVRLVHNGVSDPAVTRAPTRESDSFTVAAVGRMTHEKGFDVLLRGLSKVPTVDLVLIGDGVSRPILESLAVDLGVADRITWAGWTSERWTTKWNVDLLVVPSRVEGFGLVAVEAMLAGIPVIAARVGGLPEVVRDGETGVLVPPEDPDALASAISALKADPGRLARMGLASLHSAKERFSVESMVRRHQAMLDRAAGSSPRSGGFRRLMSLTAGAGGH